MSMQYAWTSAFGCTKELYHVDTLQYVLFLVVEPQSSRTRCYSQMLGCSPNQIPVFILIPEFLFIIGSRPKATRNIIILFPEKLFINILLL